MPQHRHGGGALLGRRLSGLEPGVERLDELEEVANSRRQIEIVAERIVPALPDLDLPPPLWERLGLGGYGSGEKANGLR
jgi:hypothetical protein